MSKLDKTELRAECAKRGIPILTKWSNEQLRDALTYDKIEYKDIQECTILVIGITKWESPTETPLSLRDRKASAFICKRPKGNIQHAGHTTTTERLWSIAPKHFTKIIVCDATPLTLYSSDKMDRSLIHRLKLISKVIVIEDGRTSSIAEKNASLRSLLHGTMPSEAQLLPSSKETILREYQCKLKKEEEELNAIKEERHEMLFSRLGSKNVKSRLERLSELMDTCMFSEMDDQTNDSPETFLEAVEDDDFCESFCESVKLFAAYRYDHYNSQSTVASLEMSECTKRKEELLTLLGEVTPKKVQEGIKEAFTDREKGLASLIGRAEIKAYVVCQLRSFARNWRSFGKVFPNVCLMGKAGSGKTTVGAVLAFVYGKSCIYCTDFFMAATRSDLVAQYIGQTAPKTKAICKRTLEGVLLIDEAYQLAQGKEGGKDFGGECLAEIVNFLDKHMACSVVIVAGYEREIKERLFGANEGLNRRFPSKVVLKDYTATELCYILVGKLTAMTAHALPDSILDYIFTVLAMLNNKTSHLFPDGPFVYQGGDMLNFATLLSRKLNSFINEPTTKQQRDAVDSAVKSFLASKVVEL